MQRHVCDATPGGFAASSARVYQGTGRAAAVASGLSRSCRRTAQEPLSPRDLDGHLVNDSPVPPTKATPSSVKSRIRRERSEVHLPVLLITAMTTDEDRERGLAAGADDYVIKPFSLAQLAATIERLLDRLR